MTDRLRSTLDALMDYLYETGAIKAARDSREPGKKLKERSEERLNAVVQRHFRRQKAAVQRMLELSAPQRKAAKAYGVLIDEVLDAMADDEWAEPLRRVLTEAAQNGVGLFGDEATLAFDPTLTNMEAAKWARKYAGELIKKIDSTTIKLVRDAVGMFVQTEGMTIGDVADLLSGAFGQGRAMLCATSEITTAYATGTMLAGQQMKRDYPGVRVTKEWFTNNSPTVCPTCAMNDGVEVDIDEPFPSGDDIPGDPHPGCMCWLSTRTRITEE